MEDNKIKVGLWEKSSKSGNKYFGGKLEIEGKTYWVTMFDNSNKTNPKAPDFNLIFEEAVEQAPATANESAGW